MKFTAAIDLDDNHIAFYREISPNNYELVETSPSDSMYWSSETTSESLIDIEEMRHIYGEANTLEEFKEKIKPDLMLYLL